MTSLLADNSVDVGTFHGLQGGFLSLSVDSLSAEETMHSLLVTYETANGAMRQLESVGWKVVSMGHVRDQATLRAFALGEDGQVLRFERAGTSEVNIFPATQYRGNRGPLRKIRPLGATMTAVGMDRQVYALRNNSQWTSIGPPGTGAKPVTGFEAICGASLDDFYCAGWRGELWRRVAGNWSRLESPTNITVLDLCAHPSGIVYGCGLAGLIVRGAGNVWSVLDQGAFDLNLYSIAVHEERVFVATNYSVLELQGDQLYAVNFGADAPKTAHTLCPVPGGLFSIGSKDIFLMQNGVWRRVE